MSSFLTPLAAAEVAAPALRERHLYLYSAKPADSRALLKAVLAAEYEYGFLATFAPSSFLNMNPLVRPLFFKKRDNTLVASQFRI